MFCRTGGLLRFDKCLKIPEQAWHLTLREFFHHAKQCACIFFQQCSSWDFVACADAQCFVEGLITGIGQAALHCSGIYFLRCCCQSRVSTCFWKCSENTVGMCSPWRFVCSCKRIQACHACILLSKYTDAQRYFQIWDKNCRKIYVDWKKSRFECKETQRSHDLFHRDGENCKGWMLWKWEECKGWMVRAPPPQDEFSPLGQSLPWQRRVRCTANALMYACN